MSLVLAAVLFWSTLGLMGKTLYSLGAEPLFVVTFRVLFALVILGVGLGFVQPRLLRAPRERIPGLALYGVVAVGANFALLFLSLQYTTVATAIVVAYSHPALVALLAWPILREPFTARKLLALALTAGGVFLVAGGHEPGALQGNLLGLGYALGNALCLAAYNLMGKRLLVRVDPWTVVFYGFLFGGVFLTALWGGQGAVLPVLPIQGWLLIVALAVFPSILAYGLYLMALRRLEASRAAIVATLEPILAAAWAWLALGEGLSVDQIMGGVLVIAGIFVLRARFDRRGVRQNRLDLHIFTRTYHVRVDNHSSAGIESNGGDRNVEPEHRQDRRGGADRRGSTGRPAGMRPTAGASHRP